MESTGIIGDVFGVPHALIDVIHVGTLPGTRWSRTSVGETAEPAVVEARTYAVTGLHGVIIENTHDRPPSMIGWTRDHGRDDRSRDRGQARLQAGAGCSGSNCRECIDRWAIHQKRRTLANRLEEGAGRKVAHTLWMLAVVRDIEQRCLG